MNLKSIQTISAITSAALMATLACACGCGSGDTQPSLDASTSVSLCANETRADTYLPNMEETGTGKTFSVKLMSSDPGPPIKGNNSWQVEVLDAQGNPVDNATIGVTPFMPDHGHGTSIKATVTPMGSGQYQISPVNLFMAGFWQITLTVQSGAQSDQIVYGFCVEG